MKKHLLVTFVAFALVATPAYAKSDTDHSQSTTTHHNFQAATLSVTPSVTITPSVTVTISPRPEMDSEETHEVRHTSGNLDATPSATPSVTPPCDPDDKYRNHGAYVSCVAHEHLGGKAVSEAARSEIGKKHLREEETPTPSISPVTSPVTSAMETLHAGFNPFASFTELLSRFFGFFRHRG